MQKLFHVLWLFKLKPLVAWVNYTRFPVAIEKFPTAFCKWIWMFSTHSIPFKWWTQRCYSTAGSKIVIWNERFDAVAMKISVLFGFFQMVCNRKQTAADSGSSSSNNKNSNNDFNVNKLVDLPLPKSKNESIAWQTWTMKPFNKKHVKNGYWMVRLEFDDTNFSNIDTVCEIPDIFATLHGSIYVCSQN